MCCRYSSNITKIIISFDIFRLIEQFLPGKEDFKKIHFTQDKFPFVMETISLLDSLFPDRQESFKDENDSRAKLEQEKRNFYMFEE